MIRNSLFISSFKRYGKRVISIILITAILYGLCAKMNDAYFQQEDWCHILWHSYYQTDEIDNLFVGSSHVYCDVNPELLDSINGMSNFNMASGSLTLSASYFLMKEAARSHDLKNLYVELYYVPNTGESGDVYSDQTIRNNWRSVSYMKPSLTKYQFAFEMSGSGHYLETLFPFVRYRSQLFDMEYVAGVIGQKSSDEWKKYVYRRESDGFIYEYREKGFYHSTQVYPQEKWMYKTQVDLVKEGMLSENNQNYMRKIIEYCQKKDITIKFFVSPFYETQVLSAGDYDAYNRQIRSIADEYGVELYDFNLCKQEYLDVTQPEYLHDAGHLNTAGTDIFTPLLWEVLTGNPAENEKYFCGSFQERIARDEPETYGVYYSVHEDSKKCVIATNRSRYYEYRIIKTPKEGEASWLQDFSYNVVFELPANESGILTIVSRDPEGKINTIEMDY